MQKQHLTLSAQQYEYLTQLLTQHTLPVNTFKRASALLALHQGQTYRAVAKSQQVSYPTVLSWANRFAQEHLGFLTDQPRSGRPVVIQGDQQAKLTALACTKAPDGRSQWSLRLLANKAVEWVISSISLIIRSVKSSKKRPQTPSQTPVVYWPNK